MCACCARLRVVPGVAHSDPTFTVQDDLGVLCAKSLSQGNDKQAGKAVHLLLEVAQDPSSGDWQRMCLESGVVHALVERLSVPAGDTEQQQALLLELVTVLGLVAKDAENSKAIHSSGGMETLLSVMGGRHKQDVQQATATTLQHVLAALAAGDPRASDGLVCWVQQQWQQAENQKATLQQAAAEQSRLRQQLQQQQVQADAERSADKILLQQLQQRMEQAEAERFTLQQQLQQQTEQADAERSAQQRLLQQLQQHNEDAETRCLALREQLQQHKAQADAEHKPQQPLLLRQQLQQFHQQKIDAEAACAALQQQLQQQQEQADAERRALLQQLQAQAAQGKAAQHKLRQQMDECSELQQQLKESQANSEKLQANAVALNVELRGLQGLWKHIGDTQLLHLLGREGMAAEAVHELARRVSANECMPLRTVQRDGIMPLLLLLDSKSADVQENAVFVMHYSIGKQDTDTAMRIRNAGGVQKLIQLLDISKKAAVQEHAAAAVCRLAGAGVCNVQAVQPLVNLLQSSSNEVQLCAAAALQNLADDNACAAAIRKCGGIERLTQLRQRGGKEVTRVAAGEALSRLGAASQRSQ